MRKSTVYVVIAIIATLSIHTQAFSLAMATEIPLLEKVLSVTNNTYDTTVDPVTGPETKGNNNSKTTSDPTAPNTAVSQDILTDREGSTVAPLTLDATSNVVSYLDFDASQSDYVQLNSLQGELNGTSRSAFMWINTATQVSGSPDFLFAINTDTGGNVALFGIDENDQTIIVSGSGTDNGTTPVTDGEWHHVGYTYNGTTFETRIYVDGELENTITQERTTTSSSRYSLGQEFDGGLANGNFYDGLMTEVSIWNTVLSSNDIDLIMQSRIENTHPQYANLVGYYGYTNCDDAALVLADNSPAGNTGVLTQEEITETSLFEAIPNFNSTGWYSPTWLENGVAFATTATTTVTPALGATPYSLELTRDFITITDNFTITGIAPEITYSGPGFTENPANDGSVSGSIEANLSGDSFASTNLSIGTDVTLGNIPDGLTPNITTTEVGVDWTSQTAAETNIWVSVTYGNGQFVAVSVFGANRVMTSPDGITWTARTAAEQNQWRSVTYGNGQFVAVSSDGTNRVMTSPDGINWTAQTAAENSSWQSVTYGNGQFVAVNSNGTNRVMTSSDGVTWTAQAAAESFSWQSVVWGNGQFVAVSTTGTNRVMTSPDGITWTPRTASEQNLWRSVTYGNGQFVAVSQDGTNRVMTSPDGITWTSRLSAEQNQWQSVTYGNGQFVAVSTSGTNRVMTSETLATLTLSGNATSHQDSDDVTDITFEFADSAFTGGDAAAVVNATGPASSNLGVDFLDNPNITYSGDGFTENPANDGTVSGSIEINLTGDSFASNPLTVGTDVTLGNIPAGLTPAISTTNAGENWTAQTAAELNQWLSVTYGNGLFVAVAFSGDNRVMTSPDGITWTSQTAAEANSWRSVTYGNGQFVAVSTNGMNQVMTSPDGINWTAQNGSTIGNWQSVTFGNGQYVTVSASGLVMTSPDGITWSTQTASEQNVWRSVTYGNGLFVAVSENGENRVMTSSDGVTWTAQAAAESFSWQSVVWGNGQFVAVGLSGANRVMTSTDGSNWTIQTGAPLSFWASITYGNGQFVAVSSNFGADRVMTSQTAATLSLSGNATDHQNSDDVGDITFEFADSAFTGGDAATVINATGPASSNLGVDFLDTLLCTGITTTWDGTSWDNNAPTANDMAIINGDYNTDTHGNITACTLVVNTDFMLEVADNTYVSVVNDITVDGDLMVANAGSVVQIANDAVTVNDGTIMVTKTTPLLNPRAFTVLGTPMSAETRTGVYGDANRAFEIVPSLFTPHPDVTAAINFTDVDFDYFTPAINLTPGEGYLVFPQAVTADNPVTFEHTYTAGTLNSGTINYPLVYNGPATENNFNVAGNPYASAIDNNLLLTENTQVNELYFWEHLTDPSAANPGDNTQNFSMNDISIYNLMGGIAAVNGGLAPGQFMTSGQGFGILADQAFDGEALTFTNAMRVTGDNGTVRSNAAAIDRLWLQVSHDALEQESTTLIGFTDQATIGFDAGYDSNRLDTQVSLFSTLESGEQLAIQGREVFDAEMEITVGFKTSVPETGNYTISIGQLEGNNLEQNDIFLIDHLLGVTTNLKETSYTFASSETLQENRFTVVFNESVLSTDDFSIASDFKVYPKPANEQITLLNQNGSTIKELTIVNVNGSIVKRVAVANQNREQTINISDLSTGIYFMSIQTDSLIKNIKIIKK